MENFDIIGVLQAYASAQNWGFVYGVDAFYKSAQSVGGYLPGQLVLITDFKASPRITNGRIQSITYTCLLMLGRKFDLTGLSATLDETSQQKYDRRIKELMQMLAAAIAQIACENNLDLTVNDMIVEINQFAENIDFAVAPNVVFTQ